MKRKFIIALTLAVMMTTTTMAKAEILKDETVYGSLNSDGTVGSIKVVNHLYGESSEPYYIDYGSYKNIKNLSNNVNPEVNGSEVKWPTSVFKDSGLYYEGNVEKQLPVTIGIKYFLDDKELKGEELAGKSGKLRLELKVTFNNEGNTSSNLMAQIQVVADQEVFTNIKTEGSKVVVGKKANISFVALPSKEQSFVLEMDGKDMELEPINITLIPATISVPQDIKSDMDKLTEGLGELEKGSTSLVTGMDKLSLGMGTLRYGMDGLHIGLNKIYGATNEIKSQSGQLMEGINDFHKGLSTLQSESKAMVGAVGALQGGLQEVAKGSNGFNEGIKGISSGITGVNGALSEVAGGMNNLTKSHESLVALAKELQGSSDPKVQALANGVLQEAAALQGLNNGVTQSSYGLGEIDKNTKTLKEGYNEFNKGVASIAENTKQMEEQMEKLPDGIGTMKDSFGAIKYGTSRIFGGYDEINKGLETMTKETKTIPIAIDKLKEGQSGVKNGISKLGNEGIHTMRTTLESSLQDSILGDKADSVKGSFVHEKNSNTTVQFLLRTPAIEKVEEKKQAAEVKEEKKGFIKRLLDLFK